MAGADDPAEGLFPGRRVTAKVVSHEPWGVVVEIVGNEQVGASIDLIRHRIREGTPSTVPMTYPRLGADIHAVVEDVRRWDHPPYVWAYLRFGPADDAGAS